MIWDCVKSKVPVLTLLSGVNLKALKINSFGGKTSSPDEYSDISFASMSLKISSLGFKASTQSLFVFMKSSFRLNAAGT